MLSLCPDALFFSVCKGRNLTSRFQKILKPIPLCFPLHRNVVCKIGGNFSKVKGREVFQKTYSNICGARSYRRRKPSSYAESCHISNPTTGDNATSTHQRLPATSFRPLQASNPSKDGTDRARNPLSRFSTERKSVMRKADIDKLRIVLIWCSQSKRIPIVGKAEQVMFLNKFQTLFFLFPFKKTATERKK